MKNEMAWKKLADEKPTEEGRYVVARDGIVFDWIEDVTQDEIEQIHKQWKPYEVTHWLLIQPPKGETK